MLEATTMVAIARMPGRYFEFMFLFRFYKVVGDLARCRAGAPFRRVSGPMQAVLQGRPVPSGPNRSPQAVPLRSAFPSVIRHKRRDQARTCAMALATCGIEPGDRPATFMRPSPTR